MRELDWLCSEKAKSAVFIGQSIGNRDREGRFLKQIFQTDLKHNNSAFSRGYATGLIEVNSEMANILNKYLDSITETFPSFVYDISVIGGKKLYAFKRTIQLIKAGKIDIRCLTSFAYSPNFELNANDLQEIFKECIAQGGAGNQNALAVGECFLASRLRLIEGIESKALDIQVEVKPIVFDFLEIITIHANREANVGVWWGKVVKSELSSNPSRIIEICVKALISENYFIRNEAKKIFSLIPEKYSALILNQFTSIILDEKTSWHFQVYNFSEVFANIPFHDFKDWLNHQQLYFYSINLKKTKKYLMLSVAADTVFSFIVATLLPLMKMKLNWLKGSFRIL